MTNSDMILAVLKAIQLNCEMTNFVPVEDEIDCVSCRGIVNRDQEIFSRTETVLTSDPSVSFRSRPRILDVGFHAPFERAIARPHQHRRPF